MLIEVAVYIYSYAIEIVREKKSGFLTCEEENDSLPPLLLALLGALSTGGLSISALCL